MCVQVLLWVILLAVSSRVECAEPLFGDGNDNLSKWLHGFDSDPRYDDTAARLLTDHYRPLCL